MAVAKGVRKQLFIAREMTYGTVLATNSGTARDLRRIQSNIDQNRDSYQSREILSSQQIRDMRLGVKRPGGAIVGELSPGTWSDIFAVALRKEFVTAGTATASCSASAATGSGKFIFVGTNPSTVFKAGDVVKGTGFSTTANNTSLFRVTSVNTTEVYVVPSPTSEATGTPKGLVGGGRKTWIPATGQTDVSYMVEHFFSDVALSEKFVGMKVSQIDINVPSTDMATIQVTMQGKDMVTASAQHTYATTIAATSTSVLAGANGALMVGGTDYAIITGMQLSISCGLTSDPVVGTNVIREQIQGRVTVQGRLTALFEDATMRDMFLNETEAAIHLVLTDTATPTPGFVSLYFPRVKFAALQKDDGEKAIIQSFTFQALENSSSTVSDLTTVMITDSAA